MFRRFMKTVARTGMLGVLMLGCADQKKTNDIVEPGPADAGSDGGMGDTATDPSSIWVAPPFGWSDETHPYQTDCEGAVATGEAPVISISMTVPFGCCPTRGETVDGIPMMTPQGESSLPRSMTVRFMLSPTAGQSGVLG